MEEVVREDAEVGEIIMDEDINQEVGQNSVLDTPVKGQEMSIREVFSHHLNEGNVSSISKQKQRKCSRKKHSSGKSLSPSEQERPKKRQRDGYDLFDIDRFIFPEYQNLPKEHEGTENSGEFLTPDLNRVVEPNEEGSIQGVLKLLKV
ncbi:hypothetical protein Hanom_Chr03g00200151 [Helianthus anomalus]